MTSPKWLQDLKGFNTTYDLQMQKKIAEKIAEKIKQKYQLRVDSTNRVVYNSRQGFIKIPDQPSQEITNTSVMYR